MEKKYLKGGRSMRKKLLALALSMSMVFGLAGCGNKGSDDSVGGKDSKSESTNVSGKTEEKEINGIKYNVATDLTKDDIELTYFHFDQKETVEYLADRFMELYPNITVKPVYNEVATYNQTLNTLVSNQDAPDVVMYSDADFALSNYLLRDVKDF